MASKEKSKEEIMRSKNAVEVLDWFKAHPSKENNDVFGLFLELARRDMRPFDPDVRFDPNPRKKL